MIKYSAQYGYTRVSEVEIPAFIQDGKLHIGHNGQSETLLHVKYPISFDASKLQHWHDQYYLYDNKEIWQLTNVVEGGRHEVVLCSFFRKASEGTHLCECQDCGERYVIDNHEAYWFSGRGLELPHRCKKCRNKRRYTK